MNSITIALTTRPENPASRIALNLANSALAKGLAVYLYVTDDGVYHLSGNRLFELAERGARLFVCAYGCQVRSLPYDDPRATYCGLVTLANLIEGTDRLISFN